MCKIAWISVIGLTLLPLHASAQIEAGDIRLSAGLASVAYSDLEVENLDIKTTSAAIGSGGVIQLGYATTERFEFGLNLGVDHQDVEIGNAESDATAVTVGPYVALNFPANSTGSVVFSPVVGAGYSGLFSDLVDVDAFQVGVGGELKWFVAKDASIDLGIFFNYQVGEAEVSGFSGSLDADGFSIGPRVKISIWP